MKNRNVAILLAWFAMTFASLGFAQNPMVGGHDMSPQQNIIQNALNSNDHTTLVAAVKAAAVVSMAVIAFRSQSSSLEGRRARGDHVMRVTRASSALSRVTRRS